jgi:putative spermidine/putrescine transport system permease protein
MTRSRPSLDLVLLAPAFLALAVLVWALGLMFRFSLFHYEAGSLSLGRITLENYARIFDALYLGSVWETLQITVWVTLWSTVLGYPLAYALVRHRRRWVRSAILALTVMPLFLGIVVRSYAWTLVLGQQGFLNTILRAFGARRPVHLLYTRAGVILALVQISVPIMVVMVAAALAHVRRDLERTAEVLGAAPLRVFWHVTLPLSLPGVVSGALVVFGWTLSSFATPVMIGGGRVYVMTVMIYDQILGSGNYPFGAALGVFVLVVDLGLLLLLGRAAARVRTALG